MQNPQDTFPVGHGNIIRAFEEGLVRSIQDLIVGLPNHDRIQIYLGSNRLRNSHTSANVSIEQWRDPLGASRQVLQNISNLLNSNENFDLDDTLQLDVTSLCHHPEAVSPKEHANDIVLEQIITEDFFIPNDM